MTSLESVYTFHVTDLDTTQPFSKYIPAKTSRKAEFEYKFSVETFNLSWLTLPVFSFANTGIHKTTQSMHEGIRKDELRLSFLGFLFLMNIQVPNRALSHPSRNSLLVRPQWSGFDIFIPKFKAKLATEMILKCVLLMLQASLTLQLWIGLVTGKFATSSTTWLEWVQKKTLHV